MNRARCLSLALLLVLALAPVGLANETPVPGPRPLPPDDPMPAKAEPKAPEAPAPRFPILGAKDLELLPLSGGQRLVAFRHHAATIRQVQRLLTRHKQLQDALDAPPPRPKGKKAREKAAKNRAKRQQELGRVRAQYQVAMRRLVDALGEHGVDLEAIERIAKAPKGIGRVARYAHAQVLDAPDLTPAQQRLLAHAVAEVNATWFTMAAQKRRLELVAKQAELTPTMRRQLVATTDAQLREVDRRFWQLMDFVLDEAQRFDVMERLPQAYGNVQNAVEHLYQLPDMTGAQATRLKALLTEVEAEAAPDQALVKRLRQELKAKGLAKDARAALQTQMREANTRLQDLQIYSARTGKEILTDAQFRAYRAIPPRLSHNDRRLSFNRVFERVEWSPAQKTALATLQRAVRNERREAQKRLAALRKESADYGPDSPQMGGMQMEMAGVAAEGAARQRELIGQVFLEVLEPHQVSAWVLGLTGRVR